MLNKLREKPDHIKRTISFVGAAVISLIIFFVWISSFNPQIKKKEDTVRSASFISSIISMFDGFISEVKSKTVIESVPVNENNLVATPELVQTNDSFDSSGVIIIDPVGNEEIKKIINQENKKK